jgi:hypothetical protein
MIKRMFYLFICPLVILASFFMPSTLAQAPTSSGLNIEISPLPIQLNAKPGTTVSSDLRIRNSGSLPETLKLSLKTFSAEGADGHIVLKDPSPTDEFLHWVSFSKDSFSAPPGAWQTVKMSVALPPTAAFGYYYAVQVELANPPKPKPGEARLQGAVAIFVLLNAESPGASRKIEVTHFSTSHSSYEFLPVDFNVQVKNTGNVHTAPHGNIFIKKGSKQIASLSVNSTEGMVLPRSNRNFAASWSDGFPVYVAATDPTGQPLKDKDGKLKTHLKWDFGKAAKLRFGHYTAQLLLVYNDGQRDIPITGTLSFWVVPWRLLGGLIIILIFMAIGFWSTFRRAGGFVKRQAKKVKKND